MKAGKRDIPVKLVISGLQLSELQNYTYLMSEAFGLDRRIDSYKGVRPITFHSWDVDCLVSVMDIVLNDPTKYPDPLSPEYCAMASLQETLEQLYPARYRR